MAPSTYEDRRLRVLIVDDDPIILTIVQRWLEDAHYDVSSHGSAFGTSGIILKSRPDVVLLDISMPGLSGDALARLINRQGSAYIDVTHVIFHSGRDIKELNRMAQDHGVLGAIQKTDDPYVFIREFNNMTAPLRQRKG